MSSRRLVCLACHREIDAAAKLCAYCGADPRTGEHLDADASPQPPELKPQTRLGSLLQHARQSQAASVAGAIAAALLALLGLHQFATHRNETAVSSSNAMPLAEVTESPPAPRAPSLTPMPEMQYRYAGNPQNMRRLVLEPGAVTPPEVAAAQQAAAQGMATPPHGIPPQAPPPHR